VTRRHVLIAGFLLLSVGIAAWVIFNSSEYVVAKIDCADRTADVTNCVRQVHKIVVLKVLGGLAVWFFIAWLLSRSQTRMRKPIGCIAFGLLGLGLAGYVALGMLGAFFGDCAGDDVCHQMQNANANYILIRAAAAGLLISIAYALYRRFVESKDV
jgi:hypothetical protein